MNESREHFAIDSMDDAQIYKLLSLAVQPRPIAWVSTQDENGVRNVAPFSFFTVASRQPPTVAISIGERPGAAGRPKDTLANLRATGEMVVNIPSIQHLEAVALSSRDVDPAVDEFTAAGLRGVPSRLVRPQVVEGALAALECTVVAEHTIGSDVVVYGQVLAVSLLQGVADAGFRVDTPAHGFLGRLAGPHFTTVTQSIAQRVGLGVDPAPAQEPDSHAAVADLGFVDPGLATAEHQMSNQQ